MKQLQHRDHIGPLKGLKQAEKVAAIYGYRISKCSPISKYLWYDFSTNLLYFTNDNYIGGIVCNTHPPAEILGTQLTKEDATMDIKKLRVLCTNLNQKQIVMRWLDANTGPEIDTVSDTYNVWTGDYPIVGIEGNRITAFMSNVQANHTYDYWCQKYTINKGSICNTTNFGSTTTKGEKPMNTFKDLASTLTEKIRPYQTYILAAAALLALDYFVFDGKGSGKIKDLANRLYLKLEAVVDRGADILFGPTLEAATIDTADATDAITEGEANDKADNNTSK